MRKTTITKGAFNIKLVALIPIVLTSTQWNHLIASTTRKWVRSLHGIGPWIIWAKTTSQERNVREKNGKMRRFLIQVQRKYEEIQYFRYTQENDHIEGTWLLAGVSYLYKNTFTSNATGGAYKELSHVKCYWKRRDVLVQS